MVNSPIRKKHSRWRVYLLLAGLAVASIFVLEATLLNVFAIGFPLLVRVAAVVVPAIVLLCFILIVTMGTKIFPWRYSIFGPYEPTPPPKGFHPHIRLNVDPQQPSFLQHLDVGREGIVLTIGRYWPTRAFLPSSAITAIGPAAWRTYVIEHDSPEIDSPLFVSQEVGEAIVAGGYHP
jgi:hypothetical protein